MNRGSAPRRTARGQASAARRGGSRRGGGRTCRSARPRPPRVARRGSPGPAGESARYRTRRRRPACPRRAHGLRSRARRGCGARRLRASPRRLPWPPSDGASPGKNGPSSSSSRPIAPRPRRVQRTSRPLSPRPASTSTSPASRRRRSLAALTALPVPAHSLTTSLGITPKRATNFKTCRSRSVTGSVLLLPDIYLLNAHQPPSDTPSHFAPPPLLPDYAQTRL